jgi:hypothetical protein
MLLHKKILKIFLSFLKEKNVLEEFIINYNNDDYYRKIHALYECYNKTIEEYITLYIKNGKQHRLIVDAFSWPNYCNNGNNWQDLNDEWEYLSLTLFKKMKHTYTYEK